MALLEQTDSIDMVGVEPDTGLVRMAIVDSVDWSDEKRHLGLVTAKVAAYLKAIKKGRLAESYPESKNRSIVIEWRLRYALPETATAYVDRERTRCEKAGVQFRARHIGEYPTGGSSP